MNSSQPLSPYLSGQNYWFHEFLPAIWEDVASAKPGIIRIGGRYNDEGGVQTKVDAFAIDDFSDSASWGFNRAYDTRMTGGQMRIVASGAGSAAFETFWKTFIPTDFTDTPVVKLKLKSSSKLLLRIDLGDELETTNEAPIMKSIPGDDRFHEYWFDFSGKFNRVNPRSISKIVFFFFGPGGPFSDPLFDGTVTLETCRRQSGGYTVDRLVEAINKVRSIGATPIVQIPLRAHLDVRGIDDFPFGNSTPPTTQGWRVELPMKPTDMEYGTNELRINIPAGVKLQQFSKTLFSFHDFTHSSILRFKLKANPVTPEVHLRVDLCMQDGNQYICTNADPQFRVLKTDDHYYEYEINFANHFPQDFGYGNVLPSSRVINIYFFVAFADKPYGANMVESESELRLCIKDIYQGHSLPDLTKVTEEAAALVQSVNTSLVSTHQDPILYWSIGNEPELIEPSKLIQSYTRAEYARAFNAVADAVRDVAQHNGQGIKLIGPELSMFQKGWVDTLLGDGPDSISDRLDVFSFHYYPFPFFSPGNNGTVQTIPQTPADVVSDPKRFDEKLEYLQARVHEANSRLNRTGSRTITMAVTETNVNLSNPDGDDTSGVGVSSFLAGQWWLLILESAMRRGLSFVNYWSISEGSDPSLSPLEAKRTDLGFIASYDPADPDAPRVKKPIYYHFKMAASYPGGTYIDGVNNDDDVIIFGIKTTQDCSVENSNIVVFVLNLGAVERQITFSLHGAAAACSPIVSGDPSLPAVWEDQVAASSTVRYVFTPDGTRALAKLVYTQEDAKNGVEPHSVAPLPRHKVHGEACVLWLKDGSLQNIFASTKSLGGS